MSCLTKVIRSATHTKHIFSTILRRPTVIIEEAIRRTFRNFIEPQFGLITSYKLRTSHSSIPVCEKTGTITTKFLSGAVTDVKEKQHLVVSYKISKLCITPLMFS